MKTKISAAILLLFLMACGSNDQQEKKDEQTTTESTETQNSKFVLKASNNLYVEIGLDSILIATQPDASKAAIFEKNDLGNGMWALKTPNGKFVTDGRNISNKLIASGNYPGEWEKFEIISLDPTKINLKTSIGKFVSADQDKGNILFANRDKVGDWETFILEPKD